MAFRPRAVWGLLGWLLLVQGQAQAEAPGQIYRCRTYGGGQFWSEQHCQQHGALIERIESVPAGIELRTPGQGRRAGQRPQRQGGQRRPGEPQRAGPHRARGQGQRARAGQVAGALRQMAGRARAPAGLQPPEATARRQEFIRNKQQFLREQREQAGCR